MTIASTYAQTPLASPAATPITAGGAGMASAIPRPTFGTETQERGAGGELKIIQWQAPSQMNAHQASGDKDTLAASLVLEPLMHFGVDAGLLPNLITDVPSIENGLLAADLTSVTLKLLPDVQWSDGHPLTSADITFTWQWVTNPDNASTSVDAFAPIAAIDTPDDLTAVVTFSYPNPLWYAPFTGNGQGAVFPEHILNDGKTETADAFRLNPIGTGPYKVTSFTVNDQVDYEINENYREPTKPYYSRVLLKGGGEAASAARAVLETGEYHFAWYLQVDPTMLEEMQKSGAGVLIVYPGAYAERMHLNFADPNVEVNGERSQKDTPHPFLTDPAVRQAIALGIDRQKLADELFLAGKDLPAKDVISGISSLASPNTSFRYDPEAAKKVLDDAGWAMGDEVRAKDGVELRMVFYSTTNQIRQKIQAVVKAELKELGIEVEIRNIDGSVYFDSASGNDQNTGHFYYDANMHQTGAGTPTPITFMQNWYAGKDGENIAQKANGWSASNTQRYQNPEYDALFESVRTETDPAKIVDLFIAMNDVLITDNALVPLVQVVEKSAAAAWLNQDNFGFGPFGYNYWNIANWNGDPA